MSTPLLQVERLTRTFPWRGNEVVALEEVSFSIARGETLGLLGESGCGKTTLARTVLRLIEPDGGSIRFDGQELVGLKSRALRSLRRRMQPVFQDPFGSLSPRLTVGEIVAEALILHGRFTRRERDHQVAALLEAMGLSADMLRRYPHELSGGQRQRIGIARALAAGPELVVADEPVSALDVSVQAQILNLFAKLRKERALTYLFIAHDLRVVAHLSDRVAVMYGGRLVEVAPTEALFHRPRHPYTQLLLASAPTLDPRQRTVPAKGAGAPLSRRKPPSGCAFHPRCPVAEERCRLERPPLLEVSPDHHSACFLEHPSPNGSG
ncbi:MAG: ABC transporter ATP-binding protein [Myxococcota bacterium]